MNNVNTEKTFRDELVIVLVLSLGTLLGSMNVTMFNMALPKMMTVFHATLPEVQWLTSAYLLAMGMSAPLMAFMANRLGSKKLFLCLTAIILVLSIGGSMVQTITSVIVVRVVFGLCAGMLTPLTLAMIFSKLSPQNHTKAMSIFGTISVCAGLLPPSVSGLLIQYLPWYSLFLFNVPFAVLAMFLGYRHLAADGQSESQSTFLIADFMLLCVGSIAILVSASNLSQWGISVQFILLLAVGILCLSGYVLKNKNSETAILSLQVFRYKQYVVALILDFLAQVAMYCCTFGMPLYLQNGMGLSAAKAGMVILPQTAICLFAMPMAGVLYEKYGPKKLGYLAAGIILVTSIPMTRLTPNTSIWLILIALTIRSGGIMMMSFLVTNLAMSSVPGKLATHASSVKNWIQQVVTSLSIAFAGGYIALFLNKGLDIAMAYSVGVSGLLICSSVMAMMALTVLFFLVKKK